MHERDALLAACPFEKTPHMTSHRRRSHPAHWGAGLPPLHGTATPSLLLVGYEKEEHLPSPHLACVRDKLPSSHRLRLHLPHAHAQGCENIMRTSKHLAYASSTAGGRKMGRGKEAWKFEKSILSHKTRAEKVEKKDVSCEVAAGYWKALHLWCQADGMGEVVQCHFRAALGQVHVA